MSDVASLGTQRLLNLEGDLLHWVELGAGRPIVLLHGLGDSHLTWRRLAPRLAEGGRRVLALDLPGHGLSARPDASYAVQWYAEIVGAWIDALGLEAFDLVGHSLGGGVAMQLLVTHGDRVGKLGLIASGGLGREVTFAVKLLGAPGVERLIGAGLSIGTRVALRFAGGGSEARARRWHAWANGAPGTARALTRTARRGVGFGGQRDSIYGSLHRLPVMPPAALYWGDRDPVIPVQHGESAAARIPGATLTRFPGCGHFPHLECSGELAAALLDFLAEEIAPAPEPARLKWRRRARAFWAALMRFLRPPPWLTGSRSKSRGALPGVRRRAETAD